MADEIWVVEWRHKKDVKHGWFFLAGLEFHVTKAAAQQVAREMRDHFKSTALYRVRRFVAAPEKEQP